MEWRETQRIENELIEISYEKGPFRGRGVWRLKEVDGQVRVSYSIYLTPVNWLFWLFAKTPLLRWKHSGDLQIILRALQKRVMEVS